MPMSTSMDLAAAVMSSSNGWKDHLKSLHSTQAKNTAGCGSQRAPPCYLGARHPLPTSYDLSVRCAPHCSCTLLLSDAGIVGSSSLLAEVAFCTHAQLHAHVHTRMCTHARANTSCACAHDYARACKQKLLRLLACICARGHTGTHVRTLK